MATKYLPLYYAAIKAPKNNDFLIFALSIVGIYSCKNKYINKNKDSLKTAIKYLPSYYTVIKKPDDSDLLILVPLTENIYSHKNKYANTKNKNNRKDEILLYIHAIEYQSLQKNRKIIIKSKLNESYKNEISNAISKDTKEKKLRTTNSCIKVYIPYSSILSNLSSVNFTKQKLISLPVSPMLDPAKCDFQSSPYQNKLKKDQYLSNSSPND